MVRDPYGNYVVQKILDIADDRQQEALCSYLRYVGSGSEFYLGVFR